MRNGRHRLTRAGVLFFVALVLAGCGSPLAPAASSGAITIGISVPTTGASAGLIQSYLKGVDLALEAVNSSGVNGRQLKTTVEDNACNPTEGANSTSKLVALDPKPVAIVGLFCSSATVAAMPIIERGQVPLLVDVAATPSITENAGVGGNKWVFRWGGSDDTFAIASIKYLHEQTPLRRISIVAGSDEYGQGGSLAVQKAVKAYPDIEVLSTDTVDLTGSADYSSVWTRVKSLKPDAVVVWFTAVPGSINVLNQYGAAGLADVPIIGRPNTDPATLDVFKRYDLKGNSAFHYSLLAETPENQQFRQTWQQKFGSADGAEFGAYGYQAIQLLTQALKNARQVTPAGVRDALEAIDYGPSLLGGRIKFDDHHQAHNNIVLLRMDRGDLSLLGLVPS